MKCLHCGREFPDPLTAEWSGSGDLKRCLIRCPHCDASHLREIVESSMPGRPMYSYRLWGHPATTRRFHRPVNGGPAAATCV
jgi:DNA-directed RNA polymerase subunit RPC12/RpoP